MQMTTRLAFCSLLVVAMGLLLPTTTPASIIEDDLNTDTSADYDEVALGSDHTVTFAFDYGAITGPAPNTTDGTTVGVMITANETQGADSAATLFHKTLVQSNARVSVDLYMGVTGTGGTTEFGSVGLGSTGNTPFTIFSPIDGDGTYLTTNGDGDSASDWRYSRPSGDDPTVATPVNNDQSDYLFGGTDAPLYTTVVPPDGIAGNEWVTLTVQTVNGNTEAFVNGIRIVQGPSVGNADGTNSGGVAPGGRASFSYADVFTSVASPGNSQFGIFDNFRVEAIPEPTSLVMLCVGLLSMLGLGRRR